MEKRCMMREPRLFRMNRIHLSRKANPRGFQKGSKRLRKRMRLRASECSPNSLGTTSCIVSLSIIRLRPLSVKEEVLRHSLAKHVGNEISMGTVGGGGLCFDEVDGRNDVCYYAWASHPTISTQTFEHRVKVTGFLKSIALKERYEKSRPIALSHIRVKRERDGACIGEFDFQPATISWNDRVLKADLDLSGEPITVQLTLTAFECNPFGGDYTSYLHVAMIKLQGDETTVLEARPLQTPR